MTSYTDYQRAYRHRREAGGEHRTIMWLPDKVLEAIDREKEALGLSSRGAVIAARFGIPTGVFPQQEKEDDQA